jgi:hypothetical protein
MPTSFFSGTEINYLGHGGRVRPDDCSKQIDGSDDETLVPVDYDTAGLIRDDDLYDSLFRPMAPGVTVVSLIDCCYSGTATVLNLPNKYQIESNAKGFRCRYYFLFCWMINICLIAVIIIVLSLFFT